MDKQRSVNTSFWDDPYIADLDITERYFFLYLLTNPHTNICGIYEVGVKIIARESGLEQEQIKILIDRFTEDKKVIYEDGWIAMINHPNHQKIKGTLIAASIRDLAKVPESVLNRAIEYGYPIDIARGKGIRKERGIGSRKGIGSNTAQAELDFFASKEFIESELCCATAEKLGVESKWVADEASKFSNHWSETDGLGTPAWKKKPTFEVKRRWVTWITNAMKWNKPASRQGAKVNAI